MKWKNKQGEELPIKDMSTDHIINCLKMIERNIDVYNDSSGPSYYMRELDCKLQYNDCPQWIEFKEELKRREK